MLILALLTGFCSSWGYDYFLIAKPSSPWQRSKVALQLHIGTWLISLSLLLLVCQRPWFAVVLVNAGQLLLLLVHHAKQHSLREAFIYQDFDYFTDAIKHPRLYLPFFGIARTIAATLGFIGAVSVGLLLENPLSLSLCLSSVVILFALGYGLIRLGLARKPTLSYQPESDCRALGQIAFFWAYWQAEKQPCLNLHSPALAAIANNAAQNQPTIIAVQSESFFDARALSPTIKAEVLKNFDAIKQTANWHGTINVPAWGANTVRTEAAFLTGLSPEQLGVHQFNPYRLFVKQAVINLVAILKQRGYKTLCIHPYPASFYERDKVFPRLGFDEFIDINAFANTEPHNTGNENGQFISDLTLTAKIEQYLHNPANNQPLFIFVITMENHGPLHLEQASENDNSFYSQTPPPQWQDLTVYLKHLQNADAMIAKLQHSLITYQQTKAREAVLCWYGDHVPIMPEVYQQLGEPNASSDYFIWQTKPKNIATTEKTIAAHELAELLLGSIN
jgi:hypothetical protein